LDTEGWLERQSSQVWDEAYRTILTNLSMIINSLIVYLERGIENDKMFYKEALIAFVVKLWDMNEA